MTGAADEAVGPTVDGFEVDPLDHDTHAGEESFDGWAFLELMGHRRLCGHVRTVQLGGSPMIRIDVPGSDDDTAFTTQYYAPSALYSLTPTTIENARAWANRGSYPSPRALGSGDPDDLDEMF